MTVRCVRVALFFLTLGVLIGPASRADAAVITYEADFIAGDVWEYTYRVTDAAFDAGQGFAIYFDETLYAALGDPPPSVNGDWDPLVVQPDLELGRGWYDALALTSGASLAESFIVRFRWLGRDTPGAQPFDIYALDFELDPFGTPVTIEEGRTRAADAAIPEPSLIALAGMGIAAVLSRRGRVR